MIQKRNYSKLIISILTVVILVLIVVVGYFTVYKTQVEASYVLGLEEGFQLAVMQVLQSTMERGFVEIKSDEGSVTLIDSRSIVPQNVTQ